jgi:hypothetical protein
MVQISFPGLAVRRAARAGSGPGAHVSKRFLADGTYGHGVGEALRHDFEIFAEDRGEEM